MPAWRYPFSTRRFCKVVTADPVLPKERKREGRVGAEGVVTGVGVVTGFVTTGAVGVATGVVAVEAVPPTRDSR